MLLALALLSIPQDPAPAPAADLQALLAEAVDHATPKERAAAARALANRDDVSLDEWIDAARSFAPLEHDAPTGRSSVTVDLVVDGEVEATELWLHVPRADADGPRPLLVALHGAGGRGAQMIGMWSRTAEATGAILLAPTEAGRNQGYTGEPREYRSVLEAIRWTRRHFDVDERRIWLTGYSRGGHVAWDLALRHPGVFAAVSPQAGGPRFDPSRGGNNMRYVENLRGTAVRALLGERDSPTMVRSARALAARAAELGIDDLELVVLEGTGHSFDPHRGEDWSAWFAGHAREAVPDQVTRAATRKDEARHGWLEITSFGRDVKDAYTPTIRTKRGETVGQEEIFALVVEDCERRTARVTARRKDDGSIALDAEAARRVTLLVPDAWISDKGKIAVGQGKRPRTIAAKRDARVLLEHFVEGFDRTFLPVARVEFKLR